MRLYTKQHKFYCGIDLHANKMYACILDGQGEVRAHKNLDTTPQALLRFIKDYREDLVVGVECVYCWYWLADLCLEQDIEFVVGHALYMKAIHHGKAKNDKIDSHKLAVMLRGGSFPLAYSYPSEMRATRDLLRRRLFFVRKRGELMAHIQMTHHQYNLKAPGAKIRHHANLEAFENPFADESVQRMFESDRYMVKHYTTEINKLEWFIMKKAKEDSANAFNLALLRTIPGVGPIIALTLLYEIHDIRRFPTVQQFSSYSRLIKPEKRSDGKKAGSGGGKIGNAHLKWIFGEATALFLRQSDEAKKHLLRLEKKHGNKARAISVLAHKLGKAVYFMLHRQEAFNANKVFQ